MIAVLHNWWGARDARERLLLRAAAALIVLGLAPLLTYQWVHHYRAAAAMDLAAARAIAADVRLIAASPAPSSATTEVGLQDVVSKAAAASGLTIARIEPLSGERLLVAFAAADSVAIYKWIDLIGRGGAILGRTSISRAGEGSAVNAEFEIGGRS